MKSFKSATLLSVRSGSRRAADLGAGGGGTASCLLRPPPPAAVPVAVVLVVAPEQFAAEEEPFALLLAQRGDGGGDGGGGTGGGGGRLHGASGVSGKATVQSVLVTRLARPAAAVSLPPLRMIASCLFGSKSASAANGGLT